MRGLAAIAVAAVVLFAAAPAQGTHISCGQTIATDAVLDNDLDCSGAGLVVGADNITLDLGGHLVNGHFGPSVGIDNSAGHDGVQIQNGFVSRFGTGIKIANADGNRVADLTILHGLGLQLTDSRGSTLTDLFVDSGFIEVLLSRSSENLVTGIRDTLVRIDEDSDRNRIEDNTRGKILVTAGSDDNYIGGNHDYQIDIRTSARATVVDNDARLIELESMRDSLVAANEIMGSAHPIGLRLAMSNGNVIEHNRVVEPLPSGIPGGDFARSALLLFGSPENRVSHNEFSGYDVGIEMTGDANRNLVSENVISGHAVSGMRLYLADENSIESNELLSNGRYGIEFQLAADRNRIERNTVSGSGVDGIFLSSARSTGNVLAANEISGSGDDGIETDVPLTTIASNAAFHNGDWGIDAVEGTTDGGGNRAWSNGQPAQCLNVVCGPGPPATLALSPESATNTVGDRHCVTATVADPDGRPTPGVTVRFSLDGDGSAGEQTDAGGTATFCYDGPLAPGTQLIAAFADTDLDGARDAGEPDDTATKTWVVPASNSCRAIGKGTLIAANGDEASFDLNVRITGGRLRGRLIYRDPGPSERLTARSRAIEALTCTPDTASIFGTALVTGSSYPVRFRIDVSESPDAYRIRLGNGYDSGGAVISSGKITIR